MADYYDQLLEATIQHFRELKAQGVRHVPVSQATLDALKKPVPIRRVQSTAPIASPKPVAAAPTTTPITPAAPKSTPSAPKPILSPDLVNLDAPLAAPAPALSREAKDQAMAELRSRALVCQKCPNLANSRTQVVFGVGSIHSPLMFVGEAPGQDEDEQGEPFVGKAGQLLTKIIQTMGLSRDTVYIANILKCRPDTPGQAYGNRKPTSDEMKTCLPYLLAQIDIIRPKVIVALGATAVEGLFAKATAGITKQRGNWMQFRDTPVMPTYHPAYLLRNQALSEKRRVWEDMLSVMERLEMPISEKQRGYFLK